MPRVGAGPATAVLWLLSTAVFAQTPSPPPLPVPEPAAPLEQPAPDPHPAPAPVNEQPPTPAEPPTWAQQCFGYPSGLYLLPLPRTGVVVSGGGAATGPNGRGTASGSSGGGSVGGGGGDGKALLVIAVLVAIALPIVVYALDDDAPPIVQQRWGCPSFQLDLVGGLDTGVAFPGARPYGQGRFTMTWGVIGGDVSFDLNPTAVNAFATHLLVRLLPKAHVEGGLAAGYRRLVTPGGQVREGFDVGLPHRYAFWRDDLRTFGLELRPSLLFGPSGIDASLEGAVIAPLFELLHVRVGARVYSFGNAIVYGAQAGLTLGI
ncbi:MAG: hypothetical protein JNJ54_30605 [Myxococcaceae bacterium]|nr:hypothetical protein [Myxococcaceae bacterium]